MAAGGTDGSLKFDTKIDTSGFDAGVSTLTKAVERLTGAIEKLSENIVQQFNGAGTAAVSASKDVESMGTAAEKSEAKVKSLQEQMDAIGFHDMEETPVSDIPLQEKAVIENPDMYGYDQSAIDFTERYTKETEKAVEQTNEFRQLIAALTAQLNGLEGKGLYFGDEEYDQTYLKLEQVKQALSDYKKELVSPTPDAKISEPVKKEAEETESAYVSMKDTVINAFKNAPAAFAKIPEAAARELKKVPGIVKSALSTATSAITSFGKALGSKLANSAKQAVSSLKGLGKSSDGVSKSILKLSSMFKMMLIRMAMRAAIQGVKEGMQNLVQYSDSANQSMSNLMSGMTYLKNSFAAAFAPILSVVAPILNTLINLLATAIGYINQFFAALGGSKTFIKAKKVNQDYAKSIGAAGGAAKQAGKDAKKALAPFDELNQLQNDASGGGAGGGGGGAGAGDMFETVGIDQGISDFVKQLEDMFSAGDWKDIGKLIGEKINDAVQSFTNYISWGRIGTKITAFVTAFTTMFNSLVGTIDWYAIGIMMGTGINTIANTLYLPLTQIDWFVLGNALSQSLMGMVDTVDWTIVGATIGAYFQAQISGLLGFIIGADWVTIGAALANGIMGLTGQIDWGQLGYLFAAGLNAAFGILGGFATTFDWSVFGNQLALELSTFFQTFDWAGAGTAISDIVIGMLDALVAFIISTDWWAFGDGVATSIENIDWTTVANRLFMAIGAAIGGIGAFLGGLIGDGVTAAKEYFQEKIELCGGNVVDGIFTGILHGMAGIATWIVKNIFTPFINGFKAAFGIHSPSTKMAEMGKYLWDGFCNGVKKFFANPSSFIKQYITDPFVNGIKNLLGIHSPSTVLEAIGGNTVDGFNSGVEKGQSSSQSIIKSWASGVASWFAEKLGISSKESKESKEWANSIMSGYNNTVSQNYTKSRSIMETWAESVRSWFIGSGDAKGVNEAAWKKFTDAIIKAFADGIQSGNSNTKSPMESWAKNVKDWFWGGSYSGGTNGLYQDFYNMAKLVNQGFANGISAFSHLAKNAVQKWGNEVIASAKSELDIHSPSREAFAIAKYFVEGFNNGLLAMLGSSVSAAEKWLGSVTGIFDGVQIGIPVGIDLPNAASYLPQMATGIVVPPRAGEFSSTYGTKYGSQDDQEGLLADIKRMLRDNSGSQTEGGDINLTVNLDGDVVYSTVVKRNQAEKGRTGKNPLLV